MKLLIVFQLKMQKNLGKVFVRTIKKYKAFWSFIDLQFFQLYKTNLVIYVRMRGIIYLFVFNHN